MKFEVYLGDQLKSTLVFTFSPFSNFFSKVCLILMLHLIVLLGNSNLKIDIYIYRGLYLNVLA